MAAGFPITPLAPIWLLGIDGPHVLATTTRTYFDPAERHRLGNWLWVVIPAAMLGPIMVAAGAESLFYVFAISWLHYHIAKQHFGFLMLYKHKARERDRTDFLLNRWFLLTSLMLPFGRFMVRNFFTGLPTLPAGQRLDAFLLTGLYRFSRGLPAAPAPQMEEGPASEHAKVNAPGGHSSAAMDSLRLRYRQPNRWPAARRHPPRPVQQLPVPPPDAVSQSLCRLGKPRPGPVSPPSWRAAWSAAPGYFMPGPFVKAAVWGIPFTHYILDSKIWRVRGNKELAAALHL
jgi:hypothetical protein